MFDSLLHLFNDPLSILFMYVRSFIHTFYHTLIFIHTHPLFMLCSQTFRDVCFSVCIPYNNNFNFIEVNLMFVLQYIQLNFTSIRTEYVVSSLIPTDWSNAEVAGWLEDIEKNRELIELFSWICT